MQTISPFLWFDDQAEQAAELYVSVFPNSRILGVSRYGEGAPQPAGTAMGMSFVLDGLELQALNGGPGHASDARHGQARHRRATSRGRRLVADCAAQWWVANAPYREGTPWTSPA